MYLETCDSESPILTLCTATGLQEKQLFCLLYEQNEVEFDTADKLIAHINVNLWRNDRELRQVYLRVDLSSPTRGRTIKKGERHCERRGCSNTFTPAKEVPWAKYCSPACKAKVYRENRRKREGRERRYGTKYGECPKGHDRSPENTYINEETGVQACRVCRRDAMREKIKTDEAYRIKVRDKERQRRAERRDEVNARRRELHRQKKEQVAA